MAFRRLFRFSLRTFLVFITIVAVWLGMEVNRGRRQQAAIAAIHKMGGTVQYRHGSYGPKAGAPAGAIWVNHPKTHAPAWLVKRMGDGFFGEVEVVDLSYNASLTVEGMRSVADLRSTRELSLVKSRLSDEMLEPIAGHPTLVELQLNWTNITDRGLKTVGTLTNLRELYLAGCPRITDAGLREIKDLQLERIGLWGTPLTGDGLVWLRNMKGLQVGLLSITPESDSGLFQVGQVPGLTDLKLIGTKVTNDGLQHLTALSNLEYLDLSGTLVSDAGLLQVIQLSHLTSLNLARTKVTDDGLQHLTALPNLEDLDLSGTLVSDAGLLQVSKLSRLRRLDLVRTKITNDGLAHLTALPNLKVLDLTRTKVSDQAIAHLRHLKNLKRLDLDRTGVTTKGVARLQKALPGCSIDDPDWHWLLKLLGG